MRAAALTLLLVAAPAMAQEVPTSAEVLPPELALDSLPAESRFPVARPEVQDLVQKTLRAMDANPALKAKVAAVCPLPPMAFPMIYPPTPANQDYNYLWALCTHLADPRGLPLKPSR
jgi:hypothetical protein